MKLQHIFILGISLALSLNTSAKEIEGKSAKPGKPSASSEVKVADCVPPTGYRQFDLNNVRFGLETAGSLWENRPGGGIPDYEVPNGSGIHSIFAGGLWMGGTSPDQQLKLAAVTYRQDGTDFWPGPLTEETALVEPETCEAFDRHWLIRRQDAEIHRLWFERNRLVNEGLEDESILEAPPFEEGYVTPQYFYEYPAINFDPLAQRDLAPYFDYNGDDFYDPDDGDYPGYDLAGEIDCNAKCATDPIPLFGDETLWWVFNDKGGIHTEFGGDPIGMEVRAQAFAFTSNDEINNMTFCNYTLVNRGTQTLVNTFFGQWVDPDLGCFSDDYVGCDVQRGLGYCYNGDSEDENCSGANGYGTQPPAVGIDFFEGPFQDADFRDNPDTTDIQVAILDEGIPYPGLGIGYGDGIGDPAFCADPACCDNERFGMRKFVYYNNNDNPINGNPDIAVEVYNYLRGFWRNGQRMTWGGNGTNINNTPTDYMFPGDTDPLGWATAGVELSTDWTEAGEGNIPADRRFLQSAGPFVLEPGEFNNITVGVVWARALSGGPLESVSELQRADDKAQSLFDSCFELLTGPDSPDITIQELDRQLVIYLSNDNPLSNNRNEGYMEEDQTVPNTYSDGTPIPEEEKFFRFQGYKIYQVLDQSVSSNDLGNPDLARLAFQCDVVDNTPEGDPIGQIVNWEFDPTIGLVVPTEKVNGANEGISHTFLVTQDLFSSEGVSSLVNHKKYYFIAVAYGYNNYEEYNYLTQAGQALPYLESKGSASGAVPTVCGIPHIPAPEANGTVVNAEYGDSFNIVRVEGEGNGGLNLELSQESIDEIMSGKPWRADRLRYEQNFGPVDVKVVDPLNVTDARLQLSFFVPDSLISTSDDDEGINDSETYWRITNLTDPTVPPVESVVPIGQRNEQIVPQYGISVQIEQYDLPGGSNPVAQPLTSELIFEDPSLDWLAGIPDMDGQTPYNWIRSGTVVDDDFPEFNDYIGKDDGEEYERILEGTVAPWYMTSRELYGPSTASLVSAHSLTSSDDLSSVNIVLTSNKDLWTRVPVIEIEEETTLAEGGAQKCELRGSLSVDKNGRNQNDPDHNHAEATFNDQQVDGDGLSFGMGWFPGYAIDIESGQRLNIAFGEASWFAAENGRDMLWNPTSNLFNQTFATRGGGFHYIYVFRNDRNDQVDDDRMPAYDGGNYLYNNVEGSSTERRRVWRSCMWVALPLLNEGAEMLSVEDGLIPTETTIKLRISTEYKKFAPYKFKYPEYFSPDGAGVNFDNIDPYTFDNVTSINGTSVDPFVPQFDDAVNRWFPTYEFETEGVSTVTADNDAAVEALDLINVVPNPYYASSYYVIDRLDNRVKIVNIPERCFIRIYDAGGTLVRTFDKDNPDTFIEWDLKNEAFIPVSGGMYIIHIDAPGIGEKVVKFFAVIRPTDLNNF